MNLQNTPLHEKLKMLASLNFQKNIAHHFMFIQLRLLNKIIINYHLFLHQFIKYPYMG